MLRDNVVAALETLVASAAPPLNDLRVVPVGIAADMFYLGVREGIGVTLASDVWLHLEQGLTDYYDHEAEMDIQLVLLATDESGPGNALSSPGKIDDMMELVLGSRVPAFTSAGIRATDVGAGIGLGAVRLRAVKSSIVPEQKRAEGAGGALAKVLLMRTTSMGL